MVQIPYEMVLAKIIEQTELSREDVEKKIQGKMKELSGLLSPEGAAHIVANELGIDVMPAADKPLKMDEIFEGMRNITIQAKVLQIYETREFERDGKKGKVASMMVGDETGRIRVTFWHDKVDLLSEIKEDDIVEISNLFARNNQGRIELSSLSGTKLQKNPKGVRIDEVAERANQQATRVMLKHVETNSFVSVLGVVVQLFRPNFFEICPECQKRARPKDGSFICDEHGDVTPDFSYVLNGVLDDGSDTIRLVFFREHASSLLEKSHEEMLSMKDSDDQAAWETMRSSVLGTMLKATGRVVENEMFKRKEIIVTSATKDIDVDEEMKTLRTLK
jgi:replication factor A1